jgi:aspartate dehydrogenase
VKVGIAGTGAVGSGVARAIDRGDVPGCTLHAVAARTQKRGREFNSTLQNPVPVVDFTELADRSDLVLEALPPELFEQVARPAVSAGKILVAMSASQLLERPELIRLAEQNGARIIIPSGAILGVDAVKAAAVGTIQSVTIQTRKPPASLTKSPYVTRMGVRLDSLTEPICIMRGTVSEVARVFPANVNVAAALSLAGIGPERTKMEIWADPFAKFNAHTVTVTSDSSNFSMSIQNHPSEANPATGRITCQSVLALLRELNSTLRVGT